MTKVVHANFCIKIFDKNKVKWNRWVEHLEGAVDIFRAEAVHKKFFLLHYMGQDVLWDKLSSMKPKDKNYVEIVQLLVLHYNP